ncbi:Carboxypeptidase D [Bertholletia excelsa]
MWHCHMILPSTSKVDYSLISPTHLYSLSSLHCSTAPTNPTKMSNPKRGFELCFYIFNCILLNISYSASLSSDPKAQQQLDEVLELPGQVFNVSFAHYSGYITVSEESGRALFYWFTEAVGDPSSKPLVLWLNGGDESFTWIHTYPFRLFS